MSQKMFGLFSLNLPCSERLLASFVLIFPPQKCLTFDARVLVLLLMHPPLPTQIEVKRSQLTANNLTIKGLQKYFTIAKNCHQFVTSLAERDG